MEWWCPQKIIINMKLDLRLRVLAKLIERVCEVLSGQVYGDPPRPGYVAQ